MDIPSNASSASTSCFMKECTDASADVLQCNVSTCDHVVHLQCTNLLKKRLGRDEVQEVFCSLPCLQTLPIFPAEAKPIPPAVKVGRKGKNIERGKKTYINPYFI